MIDLSTHKKAIDRTAIYARLEEIGRSDIIQALPMQSSFLTGPIPSLVLEQHAITVQEKAIRRRRHQACLDAAAIALNEKDYSAPNAMKAIYDRVIQQSEWVPEVQLASCVARNAGYKTCSMGSHPITLKQGLYRSA